ncbi:GNAT family N-acetyltransferase [Candidatus Bathyarchaeota archaeon]|nr:GNAT family N-acetyltransferase [Candidatus Bathyarchaeota archaeon]
MKLKLRSVGVEDAKWITEVINTPEVAGYLGFIYPRTEHEVEEQLKSAVKEEDRKRIIAELDNTSVGYLDVGPEKGRTRHIAWLGIYVKREYWGKGIGAALMREAIRVAKDYGCRRLMLSVFEGNERALKLYQKMGFTVESTLAESVYIDGQWRGNVIMGLNLASTNPRISKLPKQSIINEEENLKPPIRQLMDDDLNEISRLQNCLESTKSTSRIPPISKEKTKEWYEQLDTTKGIFCYGCFNQQKLLGYIQYSAAPPPSKKILIEETLVDVNENPTMTAENLTMAILEFQKRYGYRKVVVEIPKTSFLTQVFEKYGFKKTGAWKGYYFIDDHYVDALSYAYP